MCAVFPAHHLVPLVPTSISSHTPTSAKINISYSILFNLTTSYSSYFGCKKGISRNKTSFFLLMKQDPMFRRCCRHKTHQHCWHHLAQCLSAHLHFSYPCLARGRQF